MAATAQPRTGRTHRPRRPDLTRTGIAYEAGRSGEPAPAWIGDDPKLEDAYERGVSDREAELSGSGRDPAGPPPDAPVTQTPRASSRQPRASSGRASRTRTPRPPSTGRRQRSPQRSPSLPLGRPTLRPPSRLSVSDGSGFMLGLVLYALALNYLRHGWPGVTGWLKAKFINQPMNGLDSTNAQSPTQLSNKGLIAPGAHGLPAPPMTGPGADQPWVQGSDGKWYPLTPSAPGKITVGP